MGTRKPLTGIVAGAGAGRSDDDILDLFDRATAADEFGPVPRGNYVALAVSGGRTTAKTGTAGYTVEFKLLEGEYVGRRVWKTWYITPAAVEYTKRDLAKLGIAGKEQMRAPFPANKMVVRLTLVVRKESDDAPEKNEVTDLKFLRVHEPEPEPFAPDTTPTEGGEQ